MPVAHRVQPPRRLQLDTSGKRLVSCTASVGAMLAQASRAFQPPTGAGKLSTLASVRWTSAGALAVRRAIACIWNIVIADQDVAGLWRKRKIWVTGILRHFGFKLCHPIAIHGSCIEALSFEIL